MLAVHLAVLVFLVHLTHVGFERVRGLRPGPGHLLFTAVDEDVVFNCVVATAVNVRAAQNGAGDDVPVDVRLADGIIQIDAPGVAWAFPLALVAAEPEDVGQEVVPDDETAAHPAFLAGADVDAAGVLGVQVDVTDAVVLDDVVVAAAEDAAAGCVVDQVVRHAVPDAAHRHAPAVPVQQPDVMDVVVLRAVARGGQSLRVAAGDLDAVVADVKNVIAEGTVGRAVPDFNAGGVVAATAQVADRAGGDPAVLRVAQQHPRALAALDGQTADRDVLRLVENDYVLGERRANYRVVDGGQRPEVQRPGTGVEVPLAGRVELLKQAADMVTVERTHLVGGVLRQGDDSFLAVEGDDGNDAVAIVELRIDVDLAVFRVRPRAEILGADEEVAFRPAVRKGPTAGARPCRVEVRVARRRLTLAVEVQLAEPHALEALCGRIGLEDIVL